MKLLLDTNVLLWFLLDDPKLSHVHREEIEDLDNEVYVSIVSLFEIVIKLKIGN